MPFPTTLQLEAAGYFIPVRSRGGSFVPGAIAASSFVPGAVAGGSFVGGVVGDYSSSSSSESESSDSSWSDSSLSSDSSWSSDSSFSSDSSMSMSSDSSLSSDTSMSDSSDSSASSDSSWSTDSSDSSESSDSSLSSEEPYLPMDGMVGRWMAESVEADNGDVVTNIPDWTFYGNNATAYGNNATYIADALNGLPGVQIVDGSAFSTACVPATGSSPRTLLVVCKDYSVVGYFFEHFLHYGTGSVTNATYGICPRTTFGGIGNHYWGPGFNTGVLVGAGPVVIVCRFNGTTDKFWKNGTAIGEATVGISTGSGQGIQIGSRVLGPAEGCGFTFLEAMAWDRALTDLEVELASEFLMEKWDF